MEHSEDEIQADSAGSGRPDGVASGIPEHRRTQEALRRSQEELQSVLGSIPDYLWSADIDSQGHVAYRYYSPGVEKITGRPPDFYMLGPERWLSTVHPADMPRIQKALQDIMNGQPLQRTEEYRIILPDGTVRWVRDNVQMRRQEGSTRVDGVVSDITERKETEDALRLSEARLKEALLAAQMGVWEWTVADGALTWDESFYRIAGRDPKLLFPHAEEQAKMFAPESWERLKVAGENSLATGIPFELDLELIRPDGSKRWLIGRGKPWRDALGRITHLRGTVQDITEHARAEDALRASESRYRFLFENNVAAIFCNTLDGGIIDGNEPAARILGYDSPREMMGHKMEDFYWEPERRGELMSRLQAEKSLAGVEVKLRHKDGKPVGVIANLNLMVAPDTDETFVQGTLIDITERKRADQQMRLFEALLSHSRDIILFVRHADGRIVGANQAAIRAYGYSLEELLELSIDDLREADPGGMPRAQMDAAAAEGVLFEAKHKRKDGITFPVEVSSRGSFIEGTLTLLSVVRDITERKRTEEELFLLKHSIDVFYDGAYWTDTDNRFIYVNDAGCKALGYEREELIGKTILDVNPQASPEGLKGVWQRLRSQGFFSMESVHRRKDGSEFPVELVTTYVGFGGREFSCGFARDITKRKRTEGQLQKLSLAVEQSPATVVITDVQGNIEYVNPKFTQLTGYTAEEAMGQNPRILKSGLVPAETYRELWTTVLSGGEWHGEFANKKKNGELYWESASIVPIKDSGGVITHLLAVKEDITERKRAEEERQRSFEQLRALAARLQSIREEERMEFLFQRPSLPSALATSCPSLVLT